MEIDIDNNLDEINVHVIEEKAFEATIKPPDASAMKTALDRDGHIALHVNFDFNKATLRPDAAQVIAQVVTLRSEERRVGNECVRTCRSRWETHPEQKQTYREKYM